MICLGNYVYNYMKYILNSQGLLLFCKTDYLFFTRESTHYANCSLVQLKAQLWMYISQ
jgi:hypothetical protein